MAGKERIIYLMEYLRDHSDENHPVSTAEIRAEMERKGCPVIVSTLREDVQVLQKAGFDIQVNSEAGLPTTYSWLDRDWSMPELQILIDAVSSSQFITIEKSRELMKKLIGMAAPSEREILKPEIMVSQHVKAPNQKIWLNVQTIQEAIKADRKITFRYYQYNMEKEQVIKHAGTINEIYLASPYDTVWNSDRYYMVGYSDKRREVNTWRIDRMTDVKLTKKKRVPAPEHYHVQDYTEKVFWMYDGKEENVTLRCTPELMDQVIDKFGAGISVQNVTSKSFETTVPVCLSGTFFAWVFQFAGRMTITAPEYVQDAYARQLQTAIDDVLT